MTTCLGLSGATSSGCALVEAVSNTAQKALLAIGFSSISGTASTTQIGTGTPGASKYVDGGTGAWTTLPSAAPGGSDTQVQFNDGGSFGGDAGFTWDKTNNKLSIPRNPSSGQGQSLCIEERNNAGTSSCIGTGNNSGTPVWDFGASQSDVIFAGTLKLGATNGYMVANFGSGTNNALRVVSGGKVCFVNSINNATDNGCDTTSERVSAGVWGLTNTTWQAGDPGTRPACDSTVRGRYWHDFGGAGVKDDVTVCAKDAGDAYAWRVVY